MEDMTSDPEKSFVFILPVQGLSLRASHLVSSAYPSSRIPKGLILTWEGEDLSEEAVGFGVPIFKFPRETVFPASRRWRMLKEGEAAALEAEYDMNLVGRIKRRGWNINRKIVHRVRESASSLHRKHPFLRPAFMAVSSALRDALRLKDTFEEVPSVGRARVVYSIAGCSIRVEVEILKSGGCPRVIVMNEQGAGYFDSYCDSDGLLLKGKTIGSWDEVRADEATFMDSRHGIAFRLGKTGGASMFRGREWVSGRLAWAGLAYLLSPGAESLQYTIHLGRI